MSQRRKHFGLPHDGSASKALRTRFSQLAARLRRDEAGVGAVEFALLMPMLLVVYLMAFELTIGISVAKRATNSASTVADLVTQQDKVSKSFLNTMGDVAASIFVPYGSSSLKLKITGISIDASSNAKIAWSWANDGTKPYVTNSAATVPAAMISPNTFLVRSELSIPHKLVMYLPGMSDTEVNTITIAREYYYRQRVGSGISCTDC